MIKKILINDNKKNYHKKVLPNTLSYAKFTPIFKFKDYLPKHEVSIGFFVVSLKFSNCFTKYIKFL